jgi:hypothetical protein
MTHFFSQYRIWVVACILIGTWGINACNKEDTPVKPSGDLLSIPYTPQTYTIVKPAHFPEIDIPATNPMTVEGVQLGRRLFYDPLLSADSTMSCSSCHLGVFVGQEEPVLRTVEFRDTGENGRSDRTVESNRKRFGGEEQIHVFLANHEFDDFSQNRNHSGMVDRHAFFQEFDERQILREFQVFLIVG